MFQSLTMRGTEGSISWGYKVGVALVGWSVRKVKSEDGPGFQWSLTGRVDGPVDDFVLRQRPLLFTAPRRGGRWCWPVRDLHLLSATSVTAQLDPPEY